MTRPTSPARRAAPCAAAAAAALAMIAATPAAAALAVGAPAPDFSADAALAGKPFRFTLSEALKKGPVVLYFYPKAFTSGCTVEAHAFAEATPQFAALGATVIGMSNDDLPTLQKFSTEACRDKFAVAADPQARVIRSYDAGLMIRPSMADRISYVIGTDGKVAYSYSSLDPDGHVQNTMNAVKALKAAAR